ncbi:Eco57I restriction-modification methylase domain-containing protein [Enterococcus casseliflavus]|uniref:Eco57I restriction-modification methylase domain-containing protein n=1 Tax=Enterococcus casseliflavus TaxID=37734 RepID=UPI0039A76533
MALIVNRTVSTNFEFLLLDWDLKQRYYDRAKYIEDFFILGEYEKVIEQTDKFKRTMNNEIQGVTIKDTIKTGTITEDALTSLKSLYQLLKQTSIKAGQPVNNEFINPIADRQFQTNERKVIYIQTADNSSGKWSIYSGSEKIGDTTADNSINALDFLPNSEYLRAQANARVRTYMTTSGVPFTINWAELAYRPSNKLNPWFRDHDVHEVLERSGYKKNTDIEGNEWWKVSLDVAKDAIKAVKENREIIDGPVIDKSTIVLRPEQREAVKVTKSIFKTKKEMLWNAKMRFGKTLATYQLIKEENFKKVLIFTHRPVVSDSWFEDFEKLEMSKSGYKYGSKNKQNSLKSLKSGNSKFIYFESIQLLRYEQGRKNLPDFAEVDWDLVVIDEAHEGGKKSPLGKLVVDTLIGNNTKLLELSGTPFNIMGDYDDSQIFTWDYVMEQEAKLRWSVEKPEEPNPYESLPKVNMFTFEMSNKEKFADDSKAFNFKEFFRLNENGSFKYERDIIGFLNEITKKSPTNYPYSTEEYRNELRHSLWLLPGVGEAKALKALMDKHHIFGKEYKVINVVDNNDKDITDYNDPDLGRVRSAISDKPWETKTITLTVRKLTTGVNVKEWTAVMFLNNTSSTMNYLQAAFRAQTPYSNEVQGLKTNAYIFDFAPDRALTVMAESASINSGVGKRNTPEQKQKMAKMLNFLPIIGMQDNKMQPFNVDRMLTQLKKVYAEKAVRSGFDDDSLYSDELLTINPEAAELFEKLRGIVGKTGASKNAKKVNINNQGLTDEEHELAEKAKRKQKRQRTVEEQEAIDKQNLAKKERKNAISILRGISIRIPLMIFGMEIDISKNIDIDTFVNEVDDVSWAEFMPTGVTKSMFKEQARYYDSEVFIEAGRIIRNRAKQYDNLTYTERSEKIALLHGTFKNPDKETVLTPWHVVNMQLISTIGGLSFYNDDFSDYTIEGNPALRWIEKIDLPDIYKENSKILEINSKTGLYPLFVATSFFYNQQMKFIEHNAGKISKIDEEDIIKDVLKNNIFVIAKTPMAKTITQRTLAGYKNWETNIKYIPNITKKIKENIEDVTADIKKEFGIMKFDAVVGNPPYQENDNGKRDDGAVSASASPLYHLFFELSKNVTRKNISLIFPARWLTGAGKGLGNFSRNMLDDTHIKSLFIFKDSSEIFPNTDIKGGVLYLNYDKEFNGPAQISVLDNDGSQYEFKSYLNSANSGVFIPFEELTTIYEKVNNKANLSKSNLQSIVSGRKPFGLPTDFFKNSKKYNLPTIYDEKNAKDDIEIIGLDSLKRVSKFVPKDYPIPNGTHLIDKWKVFVPYAYGTGSFGEVGPTLILGSPGQIVTETFLTFGAFDSEEEAVAMSKYFKTKFFRAMVGILKTTQHSTTTYGFVPLEDFTSLNNDINWDQSIEEIDSQLFVKYGLSDNEVHFILNKVKNMD